jgi:hypothetical protein
MERKAMSAAAPLEIAVVSDLFHASIAAFRPDKSWLMLRIVSGLRRRRQREKMFGIRIGQRFSQSKIGCRCENPLEN